MKGMGISKEKQRQQKKIKVYLARERRGHSKIMEIKKMLKKKQRNRGERERGSRKFSASIISSFLVQRKHFISQVRRKEMGEYFQRFTFSPSAKHFPYLFYPYFRNVIQLIFIRIVFFKANFHTS
jgi:hypothetical protein